MKKSRFIPPVIITRALPVAIGSFKKLKLHFIPVFSLIIIYFAYFGMQAISADFEFDNKMLKDIETMEKRHFKSTSHDDEDTQYRLERLEETLMGHTFDDLPLDKRMKRVKIASQKKMLSGMSIPNSIRMNQTRINNDAIEIVDRGDSVGIIDGLLKLWAPQAYERFRAKNEALLKYQN